MKTEMNLAWRNKLSLNVFSNNCFPTSPISCKPHRRILFSCLMCTLLLRLKLLHEYKNWLQSLFSKRLKISITFTVKWWHSWTFGETQKLLSQTLNLVSMSTKRMFLFFTPFRQQTSDSCYSFLTLSCYKSFINTYNILGAGSKKDLDAFLYIMVKLCYRRTLIWEGDILYIVCISNCLKYIK